MSNTSCQKYHDGTGLSDCPVCKHPTNCNGYHTDETYAENPDMYDGWLGACTNCPDERSR